MSDGAEDSETKNTCFLVARSLVGEDVETFVSVGTLRASDGKFNAISNDGLLFGAYVGFPDAVKLCYHWLVISLQFTGS